jgi:uncharacterized protein YcbK (DUF882 family)
VAARLSALVLAALVAALPGVALAQDQGPERVYVVARGDTLSTIAERLGVSTRALAERNHLEAPYALRVGRRLRLPDGVAANVLRGLPLRQTPGGTAATVHGAPARTTPARGGRGRGWGRPRTPGLVRLVREYNDESLAINLRRVSRSALRRMERFLAFSDGRHHPIHPRLLRQLAMVSDHFGGRRIHVISGYRPFRRGQWTPHSNHNIGHALDFRIEGVPNRAVRDFCRTLPQTGCGFYPRSVFVHMDVRAESATWVDWSRPGQRPMYGREDRPPGEATAHTAAAAAAPAPSESAPPADESVEDVAQDNARVRDAEPQAESQPEAPAEPQAGEGSP